MQKPRNPIKQIRVTGTKDEVRSQKGRRKVQIDENNKEQKTETYRGGSRGDTVGRKMEQTDKNVRENKDYIHRHTNEGIRNRWREAGRRTGEGMEHSQNKTGSNTT